MPKWLKTSFLTSFHLEIKDCCMMSMDLSDPIKMLDVTDEITNERWTP